MWLIVLGLVECQWKSAEWISSRTDVWPDHGRSCDGHSGRCGEGWHSCGGSGDDGEVPNEGRWSQEWKGIRLTCIDMVRWIRVVELYVVSVVALPMKALCGGILPPQVVGNQFELLRHERSLSEWKWTRCLSVQFAFP